MDITATTSCPCSNQQHFQSSTAHHLQSHLTTRSIPILQVQAWNLSNAQSLLLKLAKMLRSRTSMVASWTTTKHSQTSEVPSFTTPRVAIVPNFPLLILSLRSITAEAILTLRVSPTTFTDQRSQYPNFNIPPNRSRTTLQHPSIPILLGQIQRCHN
jgi:hypothetical protein